GLAATVAARPGVLATMRADDPLVRVAGAQGRVAGIDPGAAASLLDVGVRTGSLATLRGDTVFVSTQQAAGHGWRAGSAVAIDFGSGPRTFLVAGTFADKRFLGDDYLVPITTLFGEMPDQQSQADLLLIKTDPGTSPGSVLAGLRPVLARYPDSTLLTAAQERDARAADLGDLSHVLGLFAAAVALTEILAALGIANAMTLAVAERTAELAVMRALGLTRRQLAAMIRTESAITCLLGAVPGAAVGAAAAAAVAATLTRAQTGAVTIGFSLAQVLAAVAVTCLAALLAGILPARQAGHVTVQAIAAD
ncbi:MAG: ABC transporter permease, partial [Streptosporangiaceae bacterium]